MKKNPHENQQLKINNEKDHQQIRHKKIHVYRWFNVCICFILFLSISPLFVEDVKNLKFREKNIAKTWSHC